MPKYSINAAVIGSKHLGVIEAPSAERALKMSYALDEAYVSVCHHCASQIEDPEIDSVSACNVEDDSDYAQAWSPPW